MLEYITRRKTQSCLVRSCNDLDREDRIPAKLKEIILNSDPALPQHGFPNSGKRGFHFIRWRRIHGAVIRFSPLAVRLRTTWYSGLHGREKLKYVAGKLRQHLAWRKKRLRHQAKVLAKRLTSGLRHRLYRYYLDRRRPLPDMLRNSYFPYINMVAERRYQHQPYPGTMVIYRDQGPYPDPYLGWTRFVQGEIEAFEIPVSVNHHRELMQEPAVRTLAEKLEEYLSRSSAGGEERTAQTRPSGPGIEANVVQ